MQQEFKSSPKWQAIEAKAYPRPEVKKKEKKPKNLGTKFPGGKNIKAQPDGHIEGEGKEKLNLAQGADDALQSLSIEEKTSS